MHYIHLCIIRIHVCISMCVCIICAPTGLQVGGSLVVLDVVIFDTLTNYGGQKFYWDIGGGGSSGVVVHSCKPTIKNVVVSGATLAGFSFGVAVGGSFCLRQANWANNSAHGTRLGVVAKGATGAPGSSRGVLRDMTLWSISYIAIWGFATDTRNSQPTIANMVVADAQKGLVWSTVGTSPVEHVVRLQRLTILDSVFIGRSKSNPYCGQQWGVLLPVSASKSGFSPEQCGPIGGGYEYGIYGTNHPEGSDPPLASEVRVTRSSFQRFFDHCGTSTVLEPLRGGGMNSSDVVPPLFFSETSIDEASRLNLAYLPAPQRSWITGSKCVAMDCDGLKHVIIHDLDGTLIGLGPDASVLSRAEYMSERRADTSKYTFYNIPTKMLYDPCPLNDPGDPGCDMAAYHDVLEEAGGIFSYRRRRGLAAPDRAEQLQAGAQLFAQRVARGEERARHLHILKVDSADESEMRAWAVRHHDYVAHGRQLASAIETDWRNRMVFYPGDEKNFYLGQGGVACESGSALYDPACRTPRKTHNEVAYSGYGTYRAGCTLNTRMNAWFCPKDSMVRASPSSPLHTHT